MIRVMDRIYILPHGIPHRNCPAKIMPRLWAKKKRKMRQVMAISAQIMTRRYPNRSARNPLAIRPIIAPDVPLHLEPIEVWQQLRLLTDVRPITNRRLPMRRHLTHAGITSAKLSDERGICV